MKKLALNEAAIQLPPAEIAEYKSILEKSFPQHKVSQLSQANRLKQLWTRADWLAAVELLTVAHSIKTMSDIDSSWTKKHVDKVMGRDSNEQTGSIFELNCATMLSDAGMKITPGRKNSPGYDLELLFPDGHKVLLSLKNHDMSSFEVSFRNKCNSLKELMDNRFSAIGVPSFIMIEASRFPTDEDWVKLERALISIPELSEQFVLIEICPGIALGSTKLRPESGRTFAAKPVSSQLIVKSKYHENEQNNFVSKLEKAAHNMRDKLGRKENVSHILCMRLNPTASVDYLEGFAKVFLDSEEDPGIDGIIFYQPSVIRKSNHSSVILHYTKCIGSNRWDQRTHKVLLRPFIGEPGGNPSRMILQGDGKTLLDNIDAYFFQDGDFYYQFEMRLGTQSINNPAPGIRSHLAIGDGSALSGKLFGEHENLLLL